MEKYEVTEICPNCEMEVTLFWNPKEDGYKAYCPYCGERLMLCDECIHRFNGEYYDDCDYCSKTDTCRFNNRTIKKDSEDIYEQDRFYMDLQTDTILWIYHNPDAISGDQFVCNYFDTNLLHKVMAEYALRCFQERKKELSFNYIFEYIEEECDQYLHDIGDSSYEHIKELFESEPTSIGLSESTIRKLRLLTLAKEKINEYCVQEFENPTDFSDIRRIGLGYTTSSDDKHEIQAYANLIECKTEIYVDCELVLEKCSYSLDNYIKYQLSNLSFDDIANVR